MQESSEKVKHIFYDQDPLCKFLNDATYNAIIRAVKDHVKGKGVILDVGCGRGELLEILAKDGYHMFGIDGDKTCVEMSSKYGDVVCLSIEMFEEAYPFSGVAIDCITLSHVLEHLEFPRSALVQLSERCDRLIVSVPNPYFLPNIIKSLFQTKINHVNTGHLYSWDWYHFKTFLNVACGLEIVSYYYDVVMLPVPHWFRRFLMRMRVLSFLEEDVLPKVLPRFCRSITVVLKKEIAV